MAPPQRPSRARRTRSAREQRQILIVDDEESLAFFLRQGLLEVDPDWLIDTAANGEEAVIRINRFAYGLIIADLRMPGLNGLELIQMIRALEPKTKVVLMTAYGSAKVEEEAHRLGVYRYLAKPFAIEVVKTLAVDALGAETDPIKAQPSDQTDGDERPVEQEPDKSIQGPKAARPSRAEPSPEPATAKTVDAAPTTPPASETVPDKWRDRVRAQLAQLRFQTGADLALVAGFDRGVLAVAGDDQILQVDDLVAFCARGLQAALTDQHLVGQGEAPAALLVQQGQRRSICSAIIDPRWMLIIVHDKERRSWRLDSIASAARSAANTLKPVLESKVNADRNDAEIAPQPPKARQEAPRRDRAEPDVPEQVDSIDEKPTADADAPPSASMPDVPDAAMAESDDQVLSLDQAQALGLIDEDLISRILGE